MWFGIIGAIFLVIGDTVIPVRLWQEMYNSSPLQQTYTPTFIRKLNPDILDIIQESSRWDDITFNMSELLLRFFTFQNFNNYYFIDYFIEFDMVSALCEEYLV